jgi:4-diphosphocytidyl-2C-methyl-D-erythritol kinase
MFRASGHPLTSFAASTRPKRYVPTAEEEQAYREIRKINSFAKMAKTCKNEICKECHQNSEWTVPQLCEMMVSGSKVFWLCRHKKYTQ